MPADVPRKPTTRPSREERLAKALRENLSRRKALVRAKRSRTDTEAAVPAEMQKTEDKQSGELDT